MTAKSDFQEPDHNGDQLVSSSPARKFARLAPSTKDFQPATTESKSDGPTTGVEIPGFTGLAELGSGGFGTVYKALESSLNRFVAIKVPHSTDEDETRSGLKQRFLREARIAATFEHPGLVPIYQVNELPDGRPYAVMRFLSGGSLTQLLMEGKLPHADVVTLMIKICEAVHHAHSKGRLVHRDLKPDNVLLDEERNPYVVDFGLAVERRTQSITSLAGTVPYMSPEQVRQETLDGRTDIWSLGVILYQMLTGELPFPGPATTILAQIQDDEPCPLRQIDASIPESLEFVCLKCLSKSVRDRYQTALDVADALRHAAHLTLYERIFHAIRLRHGSLVGRAQLSRFLQDKLSSLDRGLIVVHGPPGIGKSAFVVDFLRKTPPAACFFFSELDGVNGSDECFNFLCRSLSLRFGRNLKASEHLKSDARALFPVLLRDLSRECVKPGEKLVIVIDGLDESSVTATTMLHRLRIELPAGVFIIVTCCYTPEIEQLKSPKEVAFELGQHTRMNLGDALKYVKTSVSRQTAADANEPIYRSFCRKIASIGGGNFRLLTLLCRDIDAFDRLDFQELLARVSDLESYYSERWARFSRESSGTEYETLVTCAGLMAVAHGPMGRRLLAAAVGKPEIVFDWLLERLGQFVERIYHEDGELAFQLFDVTFRTFLLKKLAGDVDRLRRKLARAAWQEFRTGIPSIYTTQHLATHLSETHQWSFLSEVIFDKKMHCIRQWTERGRGEVGLQCLIPLVKSCFLPRTANAGLATQIALIYTQAGQLAEAKDWLRNALEDLGGIDAPATAGTEDGHYDSDYTRVRAIILHELASFSTYAEEFRHAIRFYRATIAECSRFAESLQDQAARSMCGVASLCLAINRPRFALRFAKRALDIANSAGDEVACVAALRVKSTADLALGRYANCRAVLSEAEARLCEAENPAELARLNLMRGRLEFEQATLKRVEPILAEKYFRKAFIQAQRAGNAYLMIEARFSSGWCAFARDRTSQAVYFFEYDLNALGANMHNELRAWQQLARAAERHQHGDLVVAASLYRETADYCAKHKVWAWYDRSLVGLGATQWHCGESAAANLAWASSLQRAARTSSAARRLINKSIAVCKSSAKAAPR